MITSSSLSASQGAPHRPYNYVSAAYLLLLLWGAAKTQRPTAALYAPTVLTRCGCLQAYSDSMVHLTRAYYVASVMQSPMLVDADCDVSDASSDAFASLCVALRQNIFAPEYRQRDWTDRGSSSAP